MARVTHPFMDHFTSPGAARIAPGGDAGDAQLILDSIGDAVMSTDIHGRVTYLNAVAERLTGWSLEEAMGQPLGNVFRILDGTTREAVQNPVTMAIRENKTLGLTPNCVLVRRDGVEASIEDSVAPVCDRQGKVTGAVMVFRDVTEARALSDKMSYLAQHDSLTHLPNRLLLNDRLTQAIALGRRRQTKLAVLFVDLDRFKHMNDSLGHVVADQLLQSVARRLLACVRESDTVCRQGGDEFVILLQTIVHPQDAAAIADKILRELSMSHRIDEQDLQVTASIGIATFPDDGTDAEVLITNADHAMYSAKVGGRNTWRFFRPVMSLRHLPLRALPDRSSERRPRSG